MNDARTNVMYDALVLDAHLRQSLVSIRSLGARGLSVAALDTHAVPAFVSRFCQQGVQCSAIDGTDSYLAFLERWLGSHTVRVVIPSSDSTVALCQKYRGRLESYAGIALAQDPALSIAINKEQTLDIARQLGLNIPRGVSVSSVQEVPEALGEIGLPVVIKPVESWLWDSEKEVGTRFAPYLATTMDEAKRVVEVLTHSGGVALFQQFLTGRREAISLLYAYGKVHARFAQWARRTEPPLGGTSVLRQSIDLPLDSCEQAQRLIQEIGLEGYSEVEFRRNQAGQPYLMEINPRLSASVEIAIRSGVNFPVLLYQWVNGDPIDTVSTYRTGIWMRYLKGDIMTTIEAIQQRGRPGIPSPTQAMTDFFLSFFKPMYYDYLDVRDLAPAIQATTTFTRDWVGGAIAKRLVRLQRRFL